MSILSKLKIIDSFWPGHWDIALDLGSSNTRVAIYNKGIVLREPTYVGYDMKNSRYLFFGAEAKEIEGKIPSYINIIKPIENSIIADFEANVALVNYFLEKSVFPFFKYQKLLKPRLYAYTTVPSSATEVEQKALEESLLKAGFDKVFLIEKPLASAYGTGYPIFSHRPVFIVDMGGGLVEMAIISLGGIIIQKTLKLAGEYLDNLIYNYLYLKYGIIIGNLTARNLKINLFSFKETNKSLTVRGKSLENRLPKSARVKSTDIKEALASYFNQMIDIIKDLLEASPPEVVSEIVKQGVILTGGLANIEGIDNFFSSDLKIPVVVAQHPEEATINGILKLIKNKDKLERVLVG